MVMLKLILKAIYTYFKCGCKWCKERDYKQKWQLVLCLLHKKECKFNFKS